MKNSGIQLRFPDQDGGKKADKILQTLTAMMASLCLSMTVVGLIGFSSNLPMVVMITGCLIFCTVYGLLARTKYESWFYIGTLVLLLLLVLCCRKQVLEGFRLFWNQASDSILRGTGWVKPEWELQLDNNQRELSLSLFSVLCSSMLSLICGLLAGTAPLLLAVLMILVLLGSMLMFGADAEFFWMLSVLGTSVLILTYSGWKQKGKLAPVVWSWFFCTVMAGCLLCVTSIPSVHHWLEDTSGHIQNRIHEKRYETKYSTLPEGDFRDYQNTERKAEPALAVTMEHPQSLYLRGFTGAVFTGERWQALDGDALAKNQELLYWLNLSAFDQNAQFDAAAEFTQSQHSTVTVQNIGACSYYRYIPFSIVPVSWTQAENLNTDGAYADGARSYVYSVVSGTSESITYVLNHLQTSDDPAVLRYRKAESGYRQFIDHYYKQVPTDVKALLGDGWDEIAAAYGGVDNLSPQQAQTCTLIFLSRCFPEEGTPEEMELPLDVAKGTTYQYATVATLTLRYFGIPARYAEGYVITEELASGTASGQTITVDSSCARAWVEVYQDGIGWLPMELTPGLGEIMESDDPNDQNSNSNGSQKEENPDQDEEPEEDPEEKPQPTGGTMVMLILKTMFKGLLATVGILLGLFLILALRRNLRQKQKEKRFQSTNRKAAVAEIFADTAHLLEKLGFCWGNGSMRTILTVMEQRYGAEAVSQFEQALSLNDLSIFSSQDLTEDQRRSVLDFHAWTIQKLNAEAKWYRRLWLKWVLCLY